MSLLIDRLFSSIAMGHLIVDILGGQRAVLLTYWSGPFHLSNAMIGLISTIYVVSAALAQPVFGYLCRSDWTPVAGQRRRTVDGLLVYDGVPHTDLHCAYFSYPGQSRSGAFHPAGAAQAAMLGRDLMGDKETTATSLFFLFGQGGGFFGPLMGGPLLERFGIPGLFPLVFLTLPVAGWAWWHLRHIGPFNMRAKVEKSVDGVSDLLV